MVLCVAAVIVQTAPAAIAPATATVTHVPQAVALLSLRYALGTVTSVAARVAGTAVQRTKPPVWEPAIVARAVVRASPAHPMLTAVLARRVVFPIIVMGLPRVALPPAP